MKKRAFAFLMALCLAASSLPLPAHAEEVTYCCGKEPHTHGDSCYSTVLHCKTAEHRHGDGCYESGQELHCTLTETHDHDDSCYTVSQNLVCETGEHTHDLVQCYSAETIETVCTLEVHTHEEACLADPNAAAPASEEEPQEETPICTCETACSAGAMNAACAICSAEGATVEGCGKYIAPANIAADIPAVDSDGDGYVEIDTAGKLWWFTHQVNNGQYDLNAELTANIDLSGTCGADIGNWLPISHSNGYKGHFNGQGYTVSNLYIASDEQYAGLFGYVKGATIENVCVTGNVSSTFYWTYDSDIYESFDGAAGGVVGHLDGGTIRNCESSVTVTGGLEFGGICGRLSSGIIEDCINRGTIICFQDSTNQVEYGGIVGNLYDGTVRGCTNHGEVTVGTRQKYVINVGGIVGRSSYGTIENCINMSSIVGSDTSTGGIVGKNWVYATVRNCGNLGTVTGDWAGGITGSNEGIIEHSWNVAAVSGTAEYVGPIAGYISTDFGNMTSNYYLSDTETTDGGRTAAQFASGQVTYELNGSTTTDASVWRQTLGTDSYPTLTGKLVYYNSYSYCDNTAVSEYSNTQIDADVVHRSEEHKFVANNDGTHNEVWSCCEAVVTENIACTAQNPDADCTTEEKCSCGTVVIVAKDKHSFDNACDTACNNAGCKHTRVTYHEPLPDDGNCTTPVRCAICQEITTEAKDDHSFDNACDTTCNNKDCKHTRTITHTPHADDGNCETAVHCRICDAIVTPAKSHSFINACDTSCNNTGCKHTRTIEHTPEDDDGNCTTDILCSICDAVTTKGNTSHTGGTATCTAKAICTVCGTAYGKTLDHTFTVPQRDEDDHWNKCRDCEAIDLKIKHSGDDDGDCTTAVECSCGYIVVEATAGHTGGTATCTAKAKCQVCGTEYGTLDADNHQFAAAWTQGEDTHYHKCIRCDARNEEANHAYDNACDTACNVCGKVRTITHTYAQAHDDTQHWQECSVCHEKKETAAHSFDNACDTTCSGCAFTRAITHTYAQAHNDTQHWQECSVCHDRKDAAAHSFDGDLDPSCNGCSFIRTVFYTVTKGYGQTVTKGNGASFTANAPFHKFVKVQVDGADVNRLRYTVDEGSTIVTLRASFIDSLSAGEHTLRIVAEDGWAETTFHVKARPVDSDSPKTGDITRTGLWIALAALGLLGLTGTAAAKKYCRKGK